MAGELLEPGALVVEDVVVFRVVLVVETLEVVGLEVLLVEVGSAVTSPMTQ
jgi:hypothetical protein